MIHRRGSAAALHAVDPFRDVGVTVPTVWWCDFTSPAIVLGSRQTTELLQLDQLAGASIDVVTRRSGGGVVLMYPGAVTWVDIIVPRGVLPDDVHASMVTVGQMWRQALSAIGATIVVDGVEHAVDDLVVHDAAMITTEWSKLVCFDGVGPGEVLLGERKLVGLSQRRTRAGSRVQGLLHHRPTVAATADWLNNPPAGAPREPAVATSVTSPMVADALAEQLRAIVS